MEPPPGFHGLRRPGRYGISFVKSASSFRRMLHKGLWTGAMVTALAGSTASAETLADAIAAAYDRNPNLVEERYLQRARDENYVQARSGYGPTLSIQTTGGYGYERTRGVSSDGSSGEVRANLSQPLYTAGRLRGALEEARSDVLGGQQTLRNVEQQTLQDVVLVYAAVLRDEARLDVARENLEVLRGQLKQNSKRQEKGDVTLTDVAQSASRSLSAEQQLAQVEADLATSRAQYVQVVGHNPGSLEPLPVLPPLPQSIEQAFARAEELNPQLLAAKYDEQATSANAASVRGERGPTVSLSGQATYSNRLLHFDGRDGSKQLFGGFTVSQPLFAAGAIQSRVRQADAQNYAAQARVDAARRGTLQSVASAWSDLAAARTGLVTGKRQIEAAQQAFAGMSCEELNGLRTIIDTLNAERELQDAQLTVLQYRYQLYVAHAGLLAAMGNLSVKDIAANITVYDPEANFRAVRHRGMTPFEYVAMGVDRIGSAGLRRPLSADLTGANVPTPTGTQAMPPMPDDATLHDRLRPIRDSELRLPDGTIGRCPLGSLRQP
jgi:TolC family type I secretion outer membrane protein